MKKAKPVQTPLGLYNQRTRAGQLTLADFSDGDIVELEAGTFVITWRRTRMGDCWGYLSPERHEDRALFNATTRMLPISTRVVRSIFRKATEAAAA